MTFANLPNGVSVFLDANTFIHHFGSDPVLQPVCQQLLERVARQEIAGFTSSHVLSDVAHRLMTLEAIAQFGWSVAGIGRQLRRHPAEIQKLARFRQAVQEIPRFGVQVLAVTATLVEAATAVSQQHGLLSGDALIVAVMQHHGLTDLATIDADFDRVPGLTRYGPV
jgi:predicted nucleic acid-binding protein